MPIDTNPLNVSGLAQLAGTNIPNMGGVRYDGLQPGLFQQAQAAALHQQQELQNAQLVQYIKNSGEMQKQLLSDKNSLIKQLISDKDAYQRTTLEVDQKKQAADQANALGYDKLAQTTANDAQNHQDKADALAATIQHNQGTLANAENKTAHDIIHQQFQDWIAKDKYDFQKQAAGMATVASTLSQIKDPTEAKKFMSETLPSLVNEGLISKDDGDKISKMTPEQARNYAASHMMIAGMISEKNPAASGLIPPQVNALGNFNLDKGATSDVQKGAIGEQRSLADIDKTLQVFNPEIFTNVGNLGSTVANMKDRAPQWAQPIINAVANGAGVGTTEWRDAVKTATTNFKDQTIQNIQDTLNQQKGVRYNNQTIQAIKDEIPDPEHDGDTAAFTKTLTLKRRMQVAMNLASQDLQNGIDPNSDKEQDKIYNAVKNIKEDGKVEYIIQSGKNQGKTIRLGWDDIKNLAADPQFNPNKESAKDLWQNEIQPYAK